MDPIFATSPNSSQMVRKMSVRADDDEDVFDVDVSDDEKYNSDNVFQGLWIPYPDQVAEMFEKLDKGGVPVLKWRCPGRRPPEVEKEEEDMETDLNLSVEPKQEEQKEEKKAPPPTEFDFDDSSLETSTTKLTPRKTPGSSKGKKRVARMDKVLDDMIRQRKATEASKDQRKKASPKTPRGAAVSGRLFSSPRTPMSAEKYAPSITPVTTPRGSGAKSPHNRLLGAKYTPPFRSASTSPRTPSSPKTPTSGEKTPTTSPSPIGCMKMTPTEKEASPNVARVMEADTSFESTAKTSCASMIATSVANTTKFTPLTQALMSEPLVSSHLSGNSLFNKPRNSLPQIITQPISNPVTAAAVTTPSSTISAPSCSALPTNSAPAATHQHFTAAQTLSGQRPTLSLFTHQNSVVSQGSPQTGVARVTQTHLPNSPLAHSPHAQTAQSPLSQPAHSPMTYTSQSPMTHTVQSPMTHTVQSPMTHTVQSPMTHTVQSPMTHTVQSPMTHAVQSPMTHAVQSPMTHAVQSPMTHAVQSPMTHAVQSPMTHAVQSPMSHAVQSPMSHAVQSPMSHAVQSPMSHAVQSPMTHAVQSPMTHAVQSPMTHAVQSPMSHTVQSPMSHTVQSPMTHAVQSPMTHAVQSPMSHTVHSPMSHTVHSPMTQLSQSPLSQPVNSPMSQTNHSPISHPIQSPISQHSQSPMSQLAHSPMAQPVQSPMSQPVQSPTAQSPLAQTAQSPSASQSPIAQTGQLRGTVQQIIPGTKPRLTFSGKPRVSTLDKPKLSMAGKPRLSLASPLSVSTSTIQSHLSSSTPTLQAQLNQAVQHQVLQQHLSQTSQQQASQLVQQQQRAQAISQQQQQQQQQQQMNQAVAQQQMVSVTESSQVQMSQQQQLAQQLQLNQQPQAQLSQQQQLAQQQQQLAQQQLSQQQQLQQLSQQQAQTPQLTPQQQQQLTLALAQQQLNQQQQTGTQSMSPQMAQQLSQLIKQQRIQMTLRQQRAAQQQQQQQLAQVKAQQLVSNQQLVQQQLAQLNAQQMAQTTSQPHLAQSTVQTSQTPSQPNVTTASPTPKVWSKPSSQHQLLQAALSQVPQNQTSLSQMIQAVKSRMNPATHPQLFKSISQLTQANQPQINQVNQLHVNQPQSTLASSSPSLSTLIMATQSPTTLSTQTHSASAVPFPSSENIQNPSQSSGHLTQVVYHSPASLVTNPSHIGPPATTTSVAQTATTQQLSTAITQPSLLVRKEEAIPAQQTQLGIQRNEPTDYKLSIFTQASTPSAAVTSAESVIPAHFVSQAQVTRTDTSHSLSRQLPNFGRKPLTSESGGLSTQLTLSETPTTSQTSTLIGQSSQAPTTQTRFVPSGLLQTSMESALLTRKRFVAPGDSLASNQERFTLATMGQAMNRAAHPTVSQANELSSPSSRERLTLASMLQPFDLAGLSQQEKQTLSTLTQSRDLSFLQNCTPESERNTSTSQQFPTINKPATTVGFPHMQIGEPQVSQSYIMPSYGPSAMIGKPPPPYSVAIAEKALSSMRTSMAGRKDTNIVTQIPSATVASVTSATEKNVTFVKKSDSSLPSTTLVWVTTPNTSSDVGGHIASSHSSFVTSQLGMNTQPTFAAGGSHVSVQKISLQQPQQSAMTSEIIKTQREKDDNKQTLDLVNTSLSAVRTAISMGNQVYPQTVNKDNMLIRKNLLGFSSLNKPSTASDMTSVTSSGISTVAANNSLLQHMLGTSTSEHLTTTSHLMPSMSTHELNLQKMSLSSASSVTSNPSLGALTSHSHGSQLSTTPSTTSSSRPRLTTIAALLNIDSGPKTQAELQLRQLSMAGITTEGLPVTSSLAQTLGIISPVSKNVNLSSITTASQVTMVPTLTSRPNPNLHATTITAESSQTEQQQTPVSES